MTDPDATARSRLDVALRTIADAYVAGVYMHERVRLSADEVVGLIMRGIAERDRITALQVAEVAALQVARTRPNKPVARGAWSGTGHVTDPWDEPTRRTSRPAKR